MASTYLPGVGDAEPVDGRTDTNGTGDTTRSWHTTAEAARALGVSPSTVRRRIADGRLTSRREPHGQSFRWLVLLPSTDHSTETPAVGAPDPRSPTPSVHGLDGVDRAALAVVRDTDDELRAMAGRVDLTRHAVISVLERERTVALRQAALIEELAEAPSHVATITDVDRDALPAPARHDAREANRLDEGSWRALLIALVVCVAAVAGHATLALPAWSGSIVSVFAVVGGLVTVVEAYLLVTTWFAGMRRRRHEAA